MIKNIFTEENLDLFCPDPFEFLPEIISMLGYSKFNLGDLEYKKKARKDVLNTLKTLFELEILTVHKWLSKPELDDKNLTIEQTLDNIEKIWFLKAEESDFYSMMMFGSPDWYVNKTAELGLTMTTNWKTFVKEKIGNLEKWIEENRPKS